MLSTNPLVRLITLQPVIDEAAPTGNDELKMVSVSDRDPAASQETIKRKQQQKQASKSVAVATNAANQKKQQQAANSTKKENPAEAKRRFGLYGILAVLVGILIFFNIMQKA